MNENDENNEIKNAFKAQPRRNMKQEYEKQKGAAKSYYDKYSGKAKVLSIVTIILLILFIILYFQMCGALVCASDPSGLVGSSAANSNLEDDIPGQLNQKAGMFLSFVAACVILYLVHKMTVHNTTILNAEKLLDSGDGIGASILVDDPTVPRDPEDEQGMYKIQIEKLIADYLDKGGNISELKSIRNVENQARDIVDDKDSTVDELKEQLKILKAEARGAGIKESKEVEEEKPSEEES